jgi:hypothetical protein
MLLRFTHIHGAGKHIMKFFQCNNLLVGFLAFRLLSIQADETIGLHCAAFVNIVTLLLQAVTIF